MIKTIPIWPMNVGRPRPYSFSENISIAPQNLDFLQALEQEADPRLDELAFGRIVHASGRRSHRRGCRLTELVTWRRIVICIEVTHFCAA